MPQLEHGVVCACEGMSIEISWDALDTGWHLAGRPLPSVYECVGIHFECLVD